jgi:hypothetical protein
MRIDTYTLEVIIKILLIALVIFIIDIVYRIINFLKEKYNGYKNRK